MTRQYVTSILAAKNWIDTCLIKGASKLGASCYTTDVYVYSDTDEICLRCETEQDAAEVQEILHNYIGRLPQRTGTDA